MSALHSLKNNGGAILETNNSITNQSESINEAAGTPAASRSNLGVRRGRRPTGTKTGTGRPRTSGKKPVSKEKAGEKETAQIGRASCRERVFRSV